MSSQTGQRHLGRKVWYGIAIALCALVILVSAACVVGTWVAGNALSSAAVQMLVVVENAAGGLSASMERIDQGVSRLEETSTAISGATSQLSQNVTDKGLVLTLLPEEREQELVSQANELQQSMESVVASLRAGLELYQSIDSLPFVSLPKVDPETVARLEQTLAGIRSTIEGVVQGIQDFRAGVSEEIGKVTSLLDQISAGLNEARQTLSELNSRLEALQALAERLQTQVPIVFTLLSVFGTLIFSWIIYTEVEVIRQYVGRWKGLSDAAAAGIQGSVLPNDGDRELAGLDTQQFTENTASMASELPASGVEAGTADDLESLQPATDEGDSSGERESSDPL